MAELMMKLVLTGARAGMTVNLGNVDFVNGESALRGDEKAIGGTARYLGRTYKAFPTGSLELAHFQQLDREAGRGTGKIHPNPQQDAKPPVQGGIQPSGTGLAAPLTRDGSTADNPSGRAEGSLSGGDRHKNSGHDGGQAQPQRILAAVNSLDPENSEHWTLDKLPRVDAVEALSGITGVTRAQIEMVASGVKRP